MNVVFQRFDYHKIPIDYKKGSILRDFQHSNSATIQCGKINIVQLQHNDHTVMCEIVSETCKFKCSFILFTNPIDLR